MSEYDCVHSKLCTRLGDIETIIYKGTGVPIFFIHGTPGDCHQVEFYLHDIIKAGHTVISISRPGYGLTPPSKLAKCFVRQANIIDAVMEAFNYDKVVLYAVSGGAAIAYKFIKLYPEKCTGVILESPIVGSWFQRKHNIVDTCMNLAYVNSTMYKFSKVTFKKFPKLIVALTLKHFSDTSFIKCWKMADKVVETPEMMQRFNNLFISIYPSLHKKGFLNDVTELEEDNNYMPEVDDIPILVFHGDIDKEIPISVVKTYFNKFKNSQFIEIPNGHHLLPLTNLKDHIHKQQEQFLLKLNKKVA